MNTKSQRYYPSDNIDDSIQDQERSKLVDFKSERLQEENQKQEDASLLGSTEISSVEATQLQSEVTESLPSQELPLYLFPSSLSIQSISNRETEKATKETLLAAENTAHNTQAQEFSAHDTESAKVDDETQSPPSTPSLLLQGEANLHPPETGSCKEVVVNSSSLPFPSTNGVITENKSDHLGMKNDQPEHICSLQTNINKHKYGPTEPELTQPPMLGSAAPTGLSLLQTEISSSKDTIQISAQVSKQIHAVPGHDYPMTNQGGDQVTQQTLQSVKKQEQVKPLISHVPPSSQKETNLCRVPSQKNDSSQNSGTENNHKGNTPTSTDKEGIDNLCLEEPQQQRNSERIFEKKKLVEKLQHTTEVRTNFCNIDKKAKKTPWITPPIPKSTGSASQRSQQKVVFNENKISSHQQRRTASQSKVVIEPPKKACHRKSRSIQTQTLTHSSTNANKLRDLKTQSTVQKSKRRTKTRGTQATPGTHGLPEEQHLVVMQRQRSEWKAFCQEIRVLYSECTKDGSFSIPVKDFESVQGLLLEVLENPSTALLTHACKKALEDSSENDYSYISWLSQQIGPQEGKK